ncbi:BrnT family toxin [Luteitalea sp.]|uniref:BrnT family toxin n=1 Tax=Luteitalea sp. TaxID=2004800 RepID=UPI0025B86525|nr:BrnT family toxin [Luteitalea sp.]
MDFEFDSAKSTANLEKHGIDFIDAQALWSDADRLEVPARSLDEPRIQVIGRIGNVVWSAFTTIRSDRIRITSVRRARDEEAAAYFEA